MGNIEDIIIQARKSLKSSNLVERPDYETLYTNIDDENVRRLFATIHYHYVDLFTWMNERLPTNENGNTLRVRTSRKLIKVIDLTNLLEAGLKNTEWAFSITSCSTGAPCG